MDRANDVAVSLPQCGIYHAGAGADAVSIQPKAWRQKRVGTNDASVSLLPHCCRNLSSTMPRAGSDVA